MDGSFVKFYGTYPKLHYTIYHCHVCRSRYGCISSSGIHNGCQTQWQQKIIFTSHIYCHGKCGMGINTSLFCTSCKQVRYENITHLCHTRIIYQFFILDHFKKSTFTENKKRISQPAWPAIKENSRELTKILLIIALRSLAYAGLIAYLPLYLKAHGTSLVESSRMISLMLFTGSIGGLIGGFMADKYGRKPILVISLALTTPLYALFLITHGWISITFLAIAGAFLLATFSITVTAAQKIISHNTGLASGLTLGLGQGIGGLGVGLIGLLADHVGFSIAIYCLCVLPLIASLFGLNLKKID